MVANDTSRYTVKPVLSAAVRGGQRHLQVYGQTCVKQPLFVLPLGGFLMEVNISTKLKFGNMLFGCLRQVGCLIEVTANPGLTVLKKLNSRYTISPWPWLGECCSASPGVVSSILCPFQWQKTIPIQIRKNPYVCQHPRSNGQLEVMHCHDFQSVCIYCFVDYFLLNYIADSFSFLKKSQMRTLSCLMNKYKNLQ